MPLYGLKGRDNISTYRTKEVGTLAVMEDQEPCRVLNGTAVRLTNSLLDMLLFSNRLV